VNQQTFISQKLDRSNWGAGEWDGEPDKVQWKDAATSMNCLMVRSYHGNWCGYVGVPEGHPWHNRAYNEGEYPNTPEGIIEVHGGLTYSDHCQEGPPEETICHVPDPGEPDKLWWFGFDCSHCDDYSPALESRIREYGRSYNRTGIYRHMEYVQEECARLAMQLARVSA
jgi:hypothetical protein